MRKLPELKDVNSDLQVSGLELDVNVDRDTAARFGITEAAVDNALYDAFGQRQVAVFYTQINQYHVVLEAAPSVGTGPDALDHIYVPSANNGQVPLSQICTIVKTQVPLSVGHQSQFPASAISFNLAPGFALGQAVTAIEAATLKLGMPPSIHGAPSGTAQAAKDSFKTLPILFIITLVVVYLVLGILYESYVQPITILSTIFSAGIGAILALWYTSTDLSTMAMIGIILLIGIVKKNAILMVDFALEQEKQGRGPVEAIYDAARLRFRPILMTTLAALLGALPLVLGSGTGIELRRPLGIAIIGGLSVSQILTLFTTPVTYLVLHPLTRKKRDPEAEDAPSVPAEPV
jgi:multidrug efflux pump